jgi:hypothetical protein
LTTSEKPVVGHISEELASGKTSKDYIALDKYLKAKENHIEVCRSFLTDEDNADIWFVNTGGKEVNLKNAADMNQTELEALVDLIDASKINMFADDRILDRLINDTYMDIHCDQELIYRFEKKNMQLRKEELDAFRLLNDNQKKEYIEKTGFAPDASNDAFRYSLHKVNAMKHGQDMIGAAREQLGLFSERQEMILDKRINAYLASQKLHYAHYDHIFEKAAASGELVTVYNYKNRNMNPVKIIELGELSPADRMALADLVDHDHIFLYAGDKKIEPVYDRYTNPDNYRQGGEFYSTEVAEAKFKAMAELRSVRGIHDKVRNLADVPSNDAMKIKLESERAYRESMADYLKGEDAKSTDTYLILAKFLVMSKKINMMGDLSEYYKRDGADIQKMVSDRIKMESDRDSQQVETCKNTMSLT